MADNKLLLMNVSGTNALSDAALAATEWDETGIAVNELAYSERMNAILRQITSVTHPLAQLISNRLDVNIGSYVDVANEIEIVTATKILNTIKNIALDVAVDKTQTQAANTIWAGPVSGISAVPGFRTLVAADVPNLDAAKITTGTFATERIANAAITTEKIADANVTAAKLAGNSVTTEKIADANVTAAKLASDSVITAKILDGSVTANKLASDSVTTVKILNASVTTAKILDAGVTLAKLGTDVVSGGKFLDSLISAKHSSVIGYAGATGTTLANYAIRVINAADYPAAPDANTIYIIKD